ncbi:EpsG family protein [Proteus vulgaris]|uniref:EpsG family protein n=1 Tax=Proteus TaxID=583 RepID=UPI0022B82AE3|nr:MULTISPECIES: EpsG family protein [Proteus]MDM3565042.1 EpsG family protein [Proteus vulgaris]
MIYYSIFLLFCTCTLTLSRTVKGNNFFYYLTIIMVIVFSGFRYDAGNDFFTYYAMINGNVKIERLEIIPKLFIELAVYYKKPFLFFLLSSLCYISSIAYFCKKNSNNKEFSFFLFLILPLSFLTSLGYVRQFMSIGFYLVALSLYINERKKSSLLFMLFSVLCHTSSIALLPIIFLYKLLSKKKIPFFIAAIMIIFAFTSSWLVKEYAYLAGNYQHYITGSKVISAGKKIGYISLFILMLFYFFIRKIKTKNDIYFFNIFFIFVSSYILLMTFGEYVVRITYILFPMSYLLFSIILYKKKEVKILQMILISIFGILMYYSTLYFSAHNETRDFLTNYSFIFMQ